ncbi:hypothetical protein EMPS_08186 [Entomortierella parvispora]|uniref:Yeast cell wall synthesis Kre9/Knh1-like N-terminal domain-containing protein n=1 Tax=Entomortierella parvispora TaxID=205924 RepID=A0A9P3HG93_9FUNG|nr:hypothetical protein EMPS_08186 [Entomortierella parvispora]
MKYSAILALASIAVVAAQSEGADEGRLYYSEPITSTVWTAGKNHTVSWTNVCKSENTGDLNIVLYKGTGGINDTEQVRVPGISAIGKLNCLKSKSATVTLPANLTTSNVYAIHVDTEPLQSYSSHFTIQGIDPVTTAPVTAPATASSAAATSGGASATTSGSSNPTDKPNGAGSLKVVGSSAMVVLAAIAMMF